MIDRPETPDIIERPTTRSSRYAYVVCTGQKRSGRACRTVMVELNLDHPHDFWLQCPNCKSRYHLLKPAS